MFLYSNTEDTITIGGDIYLPETITRSDIALGRDERKKILTINVPATNLLAQRYIGTPPGSKATLSIFGFQRTDAGLETPQIYKGSIAFILLQLVMVAAVITWPQLVAGNIEVTEKVDVDAAMEQMAPKDDMFDAAPIVDEEPPASEPSASAP